MAYGLNLEAFHEKAGNIILTGLYSGAEINVSALLLGGMALYLHDCKKENLPNRGDYASASITFSRNESRRHSPDSDIEMTYRT